MNNWLGFPLIDLVGDSHVLQPPWKALVRDVYLDTGGGFF